MRVKQAAPRAITKSIGAPIGGLNAKDGLASMPSTDAIILENFFPTPDGVESRGGSVNHVTGFSAAVESLMAYRSPTINKLFAAAGTAIYDATSPGSVGAAVISGLSNARFQHILFGTPGGEFLYCVNGTDYARMYNGTNWQIVDTGVGATLSTITAVGSLCTATTVTNHNLTTGQNIILSGITPAAMNGTYAIIVTGAKTFTYVAGSPPGGPMTVTGTYSAQVKITGIATNNFANINIFGGRLWFTESNSFRVWYLPAASVGGAATSLDFSPYFQLGGYLMGMMTWTLDNTAGIHDYAVFMSSQGEVLVYAGNDPDSTDTWALAAHFRMGRPVGRRFFVKYGSDLAVICADGIYPLHESMITDRSQQNFALSDKIQHSVNDDVMNEGVNFGWQAILYPIGNKLIVNVPYQENSIQYQYVLNTITNSWCKFIGWNANCFELFQDSLYYGGATAVVHADYLNSDNGANINCEGLQAFNYFGSSSQKHFTMVRPVFRTVANLTVALKMNVDYQFSPPSSAATYVNSGVSPWNTSPWNTSPWSSSEDIKTKWIGVSSIGYTGSIHMKVAVNGFRVKWIATDYMFNRGGPV